jgi:hypothetical protein
LDEAEKRLKMLKKDYVKMQVEKEKKVFGLFA